MWVDTKPRCVSNRRDILSAVFHQWLFIKHTYLLSFRSLWVAHHMGSKFKAKTKGTVVSTIPTD